jgi:hypothetical protein
VTNSNRRQTGYFTATRSATGGGFGLPVSSRGTSRSIPRQSPLQTAQQVTGQTINVDGGFVMHW